MYYQNYEDYMRQVLGYPPGDSTYYENQFTQENTNAKYEQMQNRIQEKKEWYPEIYKVVYPMVCKACDEQGGNEITEDAVENITNVIYTNLEIGDVNLTGNDIKTQSQELRNGDVPNPRVKIQEQREVRGMKQNNPILKDLIRILVLREFFDRRPPKPPRPPFPGNQRPPFPGGPGMVPPPPMPRYY